MTASDLLRETLERVPLLQERRHYHVYPVAAPEGAGPIHAVYAQTAREPLLCLDAPSGMVRYTYTVWLAADRYDVLAALTEAARSAVEGTMAELDTEGILIDCEWAEPARDGYAPTWDVTTREVRVTLLICEGE